MSRLASIDMGSNTFRLLIAKAEGPSSLIPIFSENQCVRLGEGFSKHKVLRPSSIDRALSTLRHFKKILQKERIESLIVTATSAVREAENQDAFLEIIRQKTGFKVVVLSGEDEARYTLSGIQLIFKTQETSQEYMVAIDIGGGSTEFIGMERTTAPFFLSRPLGAVSLTEKFLKSDPPGLPEVTALRKAIDDDIGLISHRFPGTCRFVGTAGTVTSLAAIDQKMAVYDPDKINGYSISRKTVQEILKDLSRMPMKERGNVVGLEKGRADILLAGIHILLRVMERFDYDPLYVSDYGLREGILMALLKEPLIKS